MKKHRFLTICILLLLLALPVGAEMKNGYVSNLLAPLYGGAQTKIVDSIGVPLEASVTVGDYILTADAVIGDKYNLAIVYSLTRVDGGELPENLRFAQWEQSGIRRNSGYLSYRIREDRKSLNLIEQFGGNERLFFGKGNYHVAFRDLKLWSQGEADTAVQEGVWELNFTIRYENTMKTVWRGECQVTGHGGGIYNVRRIEMSPIGMHMDFEYPKAYFEDLTKGHEDFEVSLALKDGSLIPIADYGMGGGGRRGGEVWEYNFRAMFEYPVPPENVRAVVICGTEFEVE